MRLLCVHPGPWNGARGMDMYTRMETIPLPLHSPSLSGTSHKAEHGSEGGNLLGLGNSLVCKVPVLQA